MAFYRCEICGEDRVVVARDVMVTLEETERDGERSWYGTITVTAPSELTAGHKYGLTLEDGRVGEFVVRRNTRAGDTDRAVAIHGIGALECPPGG